MSTLAPCPKCRATVECPSDLVTDDRLGPDGVPHPVGFVACEACPALIEYYVDSGDVLDFTLR